MTAAIEIKDALFKGFKNRLSLVIGTKDRFSILGSKRNLLIQILGYDQTPDPPTALKYPCLDTECWPSQVIQTVSFNNNKNKAPYLAARFESFRDEFDYTLDEVLNQVSKDKPLIEKIKEELSLKGLGDRWIVGLSNGQTRRAQLAQALLKRPRILLIEDPFMGLDPENKALFDKIICGLDIPVVLSLASSADLPKWTTDVVVAEPDGITHYPAGEFKPATHHETSKRQSRQFGEPIIKMDSVSVAYRGQSIIKDLTFVARKGERVHIKGPNGSGKSTLLAMITADHPQSWNERVILFGEPREVGKHSYASINAQIGFSSPELHSIFPSKMICARAVATGFTNDFVVRDLTKEEQEAVYRWIDYFKLPREEQFGRLNTTQQKLALLARALVKNPGILILDEAFSTFDEASLKLAFDALDKYEGTILFVSHNQEELPPVDQVLDLGAPK